MAFFLGLAKDRGYLFGTHLVKAVLGLSFLQHERAVRSMIIQLIVIPPPTERP